MKYGLATAMAVCAVVAFAVGCTDDSTGSGGSDDKRVVEFKVTEIVCPMSYNVDTLRENVKAECQFISEEDGSVFRASYRSPELAAVSLEPGEYRLIVRSGRMERAMGMPGIMVVAEVGTTYVTGQSPVGPVPSMKAVDGEVELLTPAMSYFSDTAVVYFIYEPASDTIGYAAEIEAINRLNHATGRHMDVRGITRDPRFHPTIGGSISYYLVPIRDDAYLFDVIKRCQDYMEANEGMFPPGMGIDAAWTVCMP